MRAWNIRTLSLQDGVYDARQLIGDMGECDQMVLAPLALALIDGLEHGVEPTRGESRMPDGPPQVWRAAFAHLGLPGRLPGLMELGIDPHQRHQLIRIGEAPNVPDLGLNRRCGSLAQPRNGAKIVVQADIPAVNLLIQVGHQMFQLSDLPQQESQLKGQRIGRSPDADTVLGRLLHSPGFLGPKVAVREPGQQGS
jgi:hypothetical protein